MSYQDRELPCLTHCGNAKVVALLGLGWTDFKISSLNRLKQHRHSDQNL
jgi:hypothetical protein